MKIIMDSIAELCQRHELLMGHSVCVLALLSPKPHDSSRYRAMTLGLWIVALSTMRRFFFLPCLKELGHVFLLACMATTTCSNMPSWCTTSSPCGTSWHAMAHGDMRRDQNHAPLQMEQEKHGTDASWSLNQNG